MQITRAMLDEAVAKGVLREEQSLSLWNFLLERERETPTFKPAHILYYLGGMIAIGAMTLFMTLGWEQFGGRGLLLISVAYCLLALTLTEFLLRQSHLALPAGITAVLAVAMVPLGVYGAQHLLGLWPDGDATQNPPTATITLTSTGAGCSWSWPPSPPARSRYGGIDSRSLCYPLR